MEKESKIKQFERELKYIKNERIKESAEVMISKLPDYFLK